MDAYKTIRGIATASVTEKKSQFIATMSFADSEQDALSFLASVRVQHRTAGHNVYAYLLKDGAKERCSDDGEPAKTAGVPTLAVLQHAQLTNCALVTTRYYGGILLGTGGLVRAYTATAQLCVAAAQIVTVSVCVRGVLRAPYALYEQAALLLKNAGAQPEPPQFTDCVTLPFVVLSGTETPLVQALQELCRGSANITLSQPYYAAF